MVDDLDVLTAEILAFTLKRGASASQAVAALMTAGFAILVRTVGEEEAAISLRQIADKVVTRVSN